MRDLSCLDDESFDLVYGTGTCFVPDARQVYAGVARVLRPGGLFRVDFCNPARELVDGGSWDGGAYRITVPYHVKRVKGPAEGDGEPSIQFRHTTWTRSSMAFATSDSRLSESSTMVRASRWTPN